MAGESISIPILTPGADAAARNIKQVGNASAETAGKLDVAAASLEAWNLASARSVKADSTLVQSRKAHAKADALLADAENVLAGKATVTTRLFADQGKNLDNVAAKAENAAGGFSSLAGTGGVPGGGMGALIGAGVALAPVIATVGVGLAGFGAAAVAVARPILKAAQATGGLQANMSKLDPEQRKVAQGLLGLGSQFDAFEKALKPQVLGVFNQGIQLAGHLLHDVQPVAKATGTALDAMLGQIDAEFASGTWQSFFGFMARTAGPDVALLSQTFINLTAALPPLLRLLQPVATDILAVSAAASKLVAAGATAGQGLDKTAQHENFLAKTTDMLRTVLFAPGVGLYQALKLIGVISKDTSVAQAALNIRLAGTHAATADLIHPLSTFHAGLVNAKTATDNEKAAVQHLTTALNIMGAGLLTTQQDQVTWRQAQQAATQAIKANTGSLDSNRGTALAARSAIIQSTQAALGFANQEIKVHHDTDAASAIIQAQIRYLQDHAGKSKIAGQEIDALRAALRKLQGVGPIHENIFMTGKGTWGIFGKNPVNSGLFNTRAAGGLISGGVAGRDSVPVLATPGEVVVPTSMVRTGAVDHLRGKLPGFAAGGVVPSFTGSVPGLRSWTANDWNASLRLISNSMAAGIAGAVKGALSRFSGGFGAGPGGGAPGANAALARRMMPAWGSGAEWAAWNYVAMRESGWNQFARNPTSGAYGIPQALPPGKMGAAANPPQSNPAAQIAWMISYIRSSYGDPMRAAWHEREFNWYDRGGWLPTGLSLALNTTGRPEMVVPSRGSHHGGGTTIVNLRVQVGHGTHPVAAAQEIARLLNKGALSGVKLRTSILGPG